MEKKDKKRFFLEEAAEKFELPGEIVAGMATVNITGGRRVYIENHRGILEYGSEYISVNGGRVIIKIRGEKLQIRGMSSKDLIITGNVFDVGFDM